METEERRFLGLEALASFGEICAATEKGPVPLMPEATELICPNIKVEKIVAKNGRITIKLNHECLSSKQKRAIGLYQGKRKEKHFYKR